MSTLNEIKNALNKAMDLVLEYEKKQAAEPVEEPVKFSFEKFRNHEIAVHCKTEEEAKIFISYLVGKGLKWVNDYVSIAKSNWEDHEENTTFEFDDRYNFLENHEISTQKDYPEITVIPFNPQDLD